jgi:hypothetical protein
MLAVCESFLILLYIQLLGANNELEPLFIYRTQLLYLLHSLFKHIKMGMGVVVCYFLVGVTQQSLTNSGIDAAP